MKQFSHIVNPVIMLLIIGTFVYTYFYYLKDNRQANKRDAETETENIKDATQMNDPNIVAVAGPAMKQETPSGLQNQQNQLNMQEGNEFFNQQNRQNPLAMQDENPFGLRNQQNQQAQFTPAQFPNPTHQVAVEKVLQEGHWIGLEVISITPAIAKANNIPAELSGVLVDEVTLLSAEAGLFAGDVITAINGSAVKDLKSFKYATKQVALSKQATVSVYRGGSFRDIMVNGAEELGVAQMEAAPMILATSRSPHGYYGPCERCHAISMTPANTNQLAKDQGDSLIKVAPNIRRGTPPPHRNRGTCSRCHVVL